jgi:hypothetical protein
MIALILVEWWLERDLLRRSRRRPTQRNSNPA